MKKILALLAVMALSLLAVVGVAGPSSATGGDQPSADNKKVQFCHYAGSNENGGSGTYTRPGGSEGLPVSAFYNAGHINHTNDIWPAFSYTTVGGDTVNVPAQGNQALLAFDDCEEPQVNEKVTRPEVVFNDPCGTENDVFSVAGGRGFVVGAVQTDGVIQSITVTLSDGFDWLDGSREPVRFERPAFTDVDCGTPNTGGLATNSGAGVGALIGLAAVAGLTMVSSRRRRSLI